MLCKEEIKIRRHNRYLNNREKVIEQCKEYYYNHREKMLQYQNDYNKSHKKQRNKIRNSRLHNDINLRILYNLRHRLYQVLKNNYKSNTTMNLVSCSIEQLKQHLESQFKPGMSWENYGQWHIDHIRPCASFDLSKAEEQRKCFHYTNLQPLWAEENIAKSDIFCYRKE